LNVSSVHLHARRLGREALALLVLGAVGAREPASSAGFCSCWYASVISACARAFTDFSTAMI
jgi:hypothetical protein